MSNVHAIRWTVSAFTETRCGAKTWSGEGLSTNNRARVTCADCLALLKPVATVIVPEPIARKVAAQSGFEFGGAA